MGDYGAVMLGVTFVFAALMTWCAAIDDHGAGVPKR